MFWKLIDEHLKNYLRNTISRLHECICADVVLGRLGNSRSAGGNEHSSVTLGLRFHSDVPGYITGVQFYKGSDNTGTHTGALWSSTGAKLASVTFSNETPSGWQQANFSSPVSIAANTTYVVSYTAPNGGHAHDQYYPWSNLNSGPLHVEGSAPGVFTYGSGVLFPTSTWNSSNYWVDVIFSPTTTQSSFWPNSATPGLPQVWNTSSVYLGLQFYSDVAGSVTGIQFYKGANNTGTHVGTLWTAAGGKLASVTFSNETASGWQQANFSSPVRSPPNTPYVISYTAPNGAHAQDQDYPWSTLQYGSTARERFIARRVHVWVRSFVSHHDMERVELLG